MASMIYNSYKNRLAGGAAAIDLDTDTVNVMLVTATYTPTATHAFRSDITNEVTSTNYTAGGSALASRTITGTTTQTFDAADTAWTNVTLTARYAILYKVVGTAATDPLIGAWDFGADVTATAGTFTIQWNASGILTFT